MIDSGAKITAEDTDHGKVIAIMDLAQKIGFDRLAFETQAEE